LHSERERERESARAQKKDLISCELQSSVVVDDLKLCTEAGDSLNQQCEKQSTKSLYIAENSTQTEISKDKL
jgi:hypothetical protein